MKRIDFQDEEPARIDLTREQVVARALTESKIECVKKDKVCILYLSFSSIQKLWFSLLMFPVICLAVVTIRCNINLFLVIIINSMTSL
jgi:hypothetical protein